MTLTPRFPDDNTRLLQGIRQLAALRARDAVELAIATSEETDGSSDAIPIGSIHGRDLLNAAKDGYVYRTKGEGKMTLLKRERGLILQIRPPFVHSAEMQELARIFRITPGLDRYRIKSEFSELDEARLPNPLGNDTIYVNMRSISQIMTFLSKGVCIPEEHLRTGVAPVTPGPDGLPYDWTRVTAGNFFVGAQKHRPRDAEVAVPYRGYWFFIARNDVNSRAVLAILEILFGLQEADGRPTGPLLTLPLGG